MKALAAVGFLFGLALALFEPHQLVPSFEDTDCDTAYATCEDSQLCFDTDNDRLYVCESDAWTAVDQLYDVLTTKGDLLAYGTAPTRLAVGTDGYVLAADSGEATGLKWTPRYHYGGTASVDPASCAANTKCQWSWYDDNIGAGWMCLAYTSSISDDLIMTGQACTTITDYVQCYFYNASGGAIDEGSTTLYYYCYP